MVKNHDSAGLPAYLRFRGGDSETMINAARAPVANRPKAVVKALLPREKAFFAMSGIVPNKTAERMTAPGPASVFGAIAFSVFISHEAIDTSSAGDQIHCIHIDFLL